MTVTRTKTAKPSPITLTWKGAGDYWIDWKAYLVDGYQETEDGNGEFTVPIYERAEPNPSLETTPVLSEAAVFAAGMIKWDGCFQFRFPGHLHFDGKADALAALTGVVEAVFATAAEHMPAFDEELAR